MAVVGDFSIEKPFLLIRSLVDQFVVCLRGAELVEEKFVIVNLSAEFVFGFVVTAVEKSAAIFFPRRVREFDPIHKILPIFAGFHIAHFPLLPIGAGGGEAISHQPGVVSHIKSAQRDGAVLGQQILIEQLA